MPTGYTADIEKGISFTQYAWSCARAFGALVMMRDDPADAPIPERFEPSDYHLRAIAEAEAELSAARAMNAEQIAAAHAEAIRQDAASLAERQRKADELRTKYEAMLAQVRAFRPPTPDHHQFASFMAEQIVNSIDFDCKVYPRDPLPVSPYEWQARRVERLAESLAYHHRSHGEELERTAKRNEWVSALRRALAAEGQEGM
jgi:hypothetical protein